MHLRVGSGSIRLETQISLLLNVQNKLFYPARLMSLPPVLQGFQYDTLVLTNGVVEGPSRLYCNIKWRRRQDA
jgi:hypothetical protein